MPDEFHRLMQHISDRIKGVVVAIGSGKDDDSKLHCAVTPPAIFREHLSLTQGRAVWLWAMGSQTDHLVEARVTTDGVLSRYFRRGLRERDLPPGDDDFFRLPEASSRRFLAAQPGLFTWRPRAMPSASAGRFSVIVEPAAT